MYQKSGMFNARLVDGQPDRVFDAADFAQYFASFVGNGVFPEPSTGLQVLSNPSKPLGISVQPGQGWIEGYWYENQQPLELEVQPGDSVYSRIDRVVLRWDASLREIKVHYIPGTPSAKPLPPTPQWDADRKELVLGQVSVPRNLGTIQNQHIQDTRLDKTLCGIVHGLIDQLDTTTLAQQLQDYIDNYIKEGDEEFQDWLLNLNKLRVLLQELYESFQEYQVTSIEKVDLLYQEFQTLLSGKLDSFQLEWEAWLLEKQDQLNQYPAGEWISKVEKTLGEIPEFKVLTLTREPFEFLNVKAFEVPMGLAWDIKSIPFEDSEIKTVNCVAINKPSGETEILIPNKYQATDWKQVAFEKKRHILQSLEKKTNIHIEIEVQK